jgi:pimeloyl-ACP methyl ester carboxylesterase
VHLYGSNGVDLVLDDVGPTSGTPALLLHGGGQTRQSWGRVGANLAERGYRALALDLRGHGESAWAADSDYSPASLIGDVESVRQYAGQPMALVGASLGGLISLLYADARPSEVLGLALVDVVPRNNPSGVERIRNFLAANPDGFASFGEAVEAVAKYKSSRSRPQDSAGLHRNLRTAENGRLVWHWDPAFLLRDNHSWTLGREELLADAARGLRVPTLLLVGGESDVVDGDALADFRTRVPHATVEVVAGAGHMVAADENDAFGAALLAWLATLEKG